MCCLNELLNFPFPPFLIRIVQYYWDAILILIFCALNADFKKFNLALLLIQYLSDVLLGAVP